MLESQIADLLATIDNRRTREAYARAARAFDAWCQQRGVTTEQALSQEMRSEYLSELAPATKESSFKQHRAAIGRLGQAAGGGASKSRALADATASRQGSDSEASAAAAQQLVDWVGRHCSDTRQELRDRALILLLAGTTIGLDDALDLRTGDVIEDMPAANVVDMLRQGTFRVLPNVESAGRIIALPPRVQAAIERYIDAPDGSLAVDRGGFLFGSLSPKVPTSGVTRMSRIDAYRMVRRRARAAQISQRVSPRDIQGCQLEPLDGALADSCALGVNR